MKILSLFLTLYLSLFATTGYASLSTEQIYQIDNQFGPVAYQIQLGTLLHNVELVANSVLADGKVWIGDGTNTATARTPSGDVTVSNTGVTAIGAGKVLETMLAAPTGAALYAGRVARAVWDPSGVAGDRTVAAHSLGVTLPAKAIITRSWFYTKTALVSTSNDGTIEFSCGATDLYAAADIDGSDGLIGHIGAGIQTGAAANMSFLSASCALTATVAVHAFTAGKVDLFVEYVVAE